MADAFLRSAGTGSLQLLPAQEWHISLLTVLGVARPGEVTLEVPGLKQEWQQEAPHEGSHVPSSGHPYVQGDTWHSLRNGPQVMAEVKFAEKVGLI